MFYLYFYVPCLKPAVFNLLCYKSRLERDFKAQVLAAIFLSFCPNLSVKYEIWSIILDISDKFQIWKKVLCSKKVFHSWYPDAFRRLRNTVLNKYITPSSPPTLKYVSQKVVFCYLAESHLYRSSRKSYLFSLCVHT